MQEINSLANKVEENIRYLTPIEELNRVLGGGVRSSVILLGGWIPGIGKSTLLLQLACKFLSANKMGCLYITGEESTDQIKLRAKRLGILDNNTNLLA